MIGIAEGYEALSRALIVSQTTERSSFRFRIHRTVATPFWSRSSTPTDAKMTISRLEHAVATVRAAVTLLSINRPSIYCCGRPSTAMIWKLAYLFPTSLAFWYSGELNQV